MKTGSETCTVILMNWTSQPPEMSFSILCVHLLFDYLVNFELGGVPIVSDKPYFEGKKNCLCPATNFSLSFTKRTISFE